MVVDRKKTEGTSSTMFGVATTARTIVFAKYYKIVFTFVVRQTDVRTDGWSRDYYVTTIISWLDR